MLDNKINSQDFINFCNETLDISGKIALAHFRDIRDLTIKVDESPVTLADKQIEQVIRREIEKKYPKHNIVGEEFEVLNNESEYTWYIDPIDGTRSFIAGKNDFGTLIGLVKNDEIIGGVIDCPALKERWVSFEKNITMVNGNIIQCRKIDKLENSVMATTSSHQFGMKKWRAYQSLEESVKVTTTGSDCYNYGLLASGYVDIVAEKLTAPHDYLPLIKIVEGSGGVMTDWDGNRLPLDDKDVYVLASASKELHELALEKLKKLKSMTVFSSKNLSSFIYNFIMGDV